MPAPPSSIFQEFRPWGNFTQYTHNQLSTIKIIEINADGILSLQLHHHRDELWVPLDDGVVAEIGEKIIRAEKGKPLFVPRETKHRLSASKTARVLEIAFGNFDENDIVRLEDAYGRAPKH
jgi:mannose-6-phosphate isomerase-like protein (cupin superfamily)